MYKSAPEKVILYVDNDFSSEKVLLVLYENDRRVVVAVMKPALVKLDEGVCFIKLKTGARDVGKIHDRRQ